MNESHPSSSPYNQLEHLIGTCSTQEDTPGLQEDVRFKMNYQPALNVMEAKRDFQVHKAEI